MYRGFDLDVKLEDVSRFLEHGKSLYVDLKATTETSLDRFISPDCVIDGSDLQENWFPGVDADIFISHSHQYLDIAMAVAGWFDKTFGLKCFIDSCIWKHCDKSLQRIDSWFIWNKEENTCDYTSRNYSTSHVHMMLSVALTQMIGRCECFFLKYNRICYRIRCGE